MTSDQYVLKKIKALNLQLPKKLEALPSQPWAMKLAKRLAHGFPEDIIEHYIVPAVHTTDELRSRLGSSAWTRHVDIERLRPLTEKYFDWKGHDFARKFANIICPPLLAQCLMLHGQCHSHQRLVDAKVQAGKARVAASSADTTDVRMSYHPEKLLKLEISAERPLAGYERKFSFDPTAIQRTWVPEWLVRHGGPQSLVDNLEGDGSAMGRSRTQHRQMDPDTVGPEPISRRRPRSSESPTRPSKARRTSANESRRLESIGFVVPDLDPYLDFVNDFPDLTSRSPWIGTVLPRGLDDAPDSPQLPTAVPAFERDIARAVNLSRIETTLDQIISITSSPCASSQS
jgi:hypothetical protein